MPLSGEYMLDERAGWLMRHALPHERALRAWLRASMPGELDIDDVVQETYARLTGVAAVDAIRNPRSYMFQTARSVIVSYIRRQQVVAIQALEDIDSPAQFESDEPGPDRIVTGRRDLQQVADAIRAMPARAREVFLMRRMDGLSQREIAASLGISESTVEKHMAKAIYRLSQIFSHDGEDGGSGLTGDNTIGAGRVRTI